MTTKLHAFIAAASVTVALAGCGGSNAKKYDISPIFPLSPDKCAKYGGDQEGSGATGTCMVTKAECEKAAADWRNVMTRRGINDAIQFSCN